MFLASLGDQESLYLLGLGHDSSRAWGLMHTPNAYDYTLLLLYAFVCVCVCLCAYVYTCTFIVRGQSWVSSSVTPTCIS